MSQKRNVILAGIFLIGSLALICVSCGGTGTTGGNPVVDMSFGGYTTQNWMERLFEETAYASVTDLQLCFKRLRFKQAGETDAADPALDPDNQDFSIGQVTISGLGTHLGAVQVKPATYVRVEFDLDNSCTSGLSIQVTNGNGTFSTNATTTIKFQGSFTASSGSQALALGIQNIATQLNSVTSNSQVQAQAQAASGTF